ncbi:MAG: hypothetical protein ACYTGQ_19890, partial [Planctomycetota bacterium]
MARNVPGVAHLLGYCYRCQTSIDPGVTECPHCHTLAPTPDDRETLGLAALDPNVEEQAAKARAKISITHKNGNGGAAHPKPVSNHARAPRAIILEKATLPSPPPANGSMSMAIDLNPNDAAAPPAITTLDHPITTN